MKASATMFILSLTLLAACQGHVNAPSVAKEDETTHVSKSLAGKTYSRTFVTKPLLGRPGGKQTHFLKFSADGLSVVDNANTFFGNPPATYNYELEGLLLKVTEENNHIAKYTLSADGKTLTSETGAVLTLLMQKDEAQEQTLALTQSEITAAIQLFNRVKVPLTGNSACTQQVATLKSKVVGFNPAEWSVSFEGDEVPLAEGEKGAAIALFNRAKVPAVEVNSVTLTSEALIKSRECGFSPAQWTLTFKSKARN